jgi:3-phosphoshikimate 1-carboxyvinyltransferase
MHAAAAPSAGRDLRPAQEIVGEIVVPADKSVAHRALIFSALAVGRSTIQARQPGEDVLSTFAALRALGVPARAETAGDGESTVFHVDGHGREGELGRLAGGQVDSGNSGTTMRLLLGALAGAGGETEVTLTGDPSLSRRPMERVAAPLRAMGADVETTDGRPPIRVRGRRPLLAIEHRLPVASAQVLGALSLAALAADGQSTIAVPGPTRDHSERMLSAMGAPISRSTAADGSSVTSVDGPAGLMALSMEVPGDFSSAAAWLVAAAAHPAARLRLPGVNLNPTRTALLDVLREMGASVAIEVAGEQAGEPIGVVTVSSAPAGLRAVRIEPAQVPALIDELPLLAVAMAAADGTSEVRGAQELRLKESDRIAAMAAALSAVGADVEELPDGWRIRRGRPREATITTHGDHRLAMAMAVAAWAGVAAGVTLDDPNCVAVSYPTFWRDAAALGLAR